MQLLAVTARFDRAPPHFTLRSQLLLLPAKMISDIGAYDQTYNIPKAIFKFVGIRMLREDTRRTRITCRLLYGLELLLMVSGMLQETAHMAQVARGGAFQDAVDILRMMPCLGYIILAVAKSYKMVAYRPMYENLYRELRDMWPRGRVDPDEYHVIHAGLKELNLVIRSYYVCNYVMWFLFMLPPYVALAQRRAGRDAPKTLPFYLWFPFDPFQPIVYEVLLAIQTWCGLMTVLLLVVADMMYCIFLSHLSRLLRLLALRIQKFVYVPIDDQLPDSYPLGKASKRYEAKDELAVTASSTQDRERRHVRELEEIIQRQRALIRLVGDVELLNSFQLLLNFCNSSVIICACGFCSVVVEKLTELKYKSFLLTALIQTWLLCWFGQKISDSSIDVAAALYDSGWYSASTTIRSTIIIMIFRSQKAVNITTYGFSVVNLASFTTIVKTAWSYFTLLLKLYED